MTLAFVQGTTAAATANPATTAAFGSATTVGSLIVVAIGNDSGGTVTITGVTDSKGNTYTKIMGVSSPSLDIYYTKVTTGGTGHTVTVNWSLAAAGHCNVVAQEFSGSSATSPLDVTSQVSGTSTTATSPATAVTAVANSLVISAATYASTATTMTAGSGYSNLTTSNTATDGNIGMASKVVAATGTQTATMTLGASKSWKIACIVFKETDAPAGPSVAVLTGTFLAL